MVLFSKLEVLFLCQHYVSVFKSLLPHTYILPHPAFTDNNSMRSFVSGFVLWGFFARLPAYMQPLLAK